MIKLISAICLFVLCQFAYAQTCPTISDIKRNKLVGWNAFDSDDGKPLSKERDKQFKQGVEEFALAEWRKKDAKTGAIHCYYRDKTGSDLEAYLAKDHYMPNSAHAYWYEVTGFMHCAAGMDKCEFRQDAVQTTRFAKK